MKHRLRFLGLLTALLCWGLPLPGAQAATITPNIITDPPIGDDDENCSLRYAIEAINDGGTGDVPGCAAFTTGSFGDGDTIILAAETYVLDVDGGNEDNNQTGDLDIHVSVTITGAGSSQTAVSGSGFTDGEEDRVFHIIEGIVPVGAFTPSITVNFNGLTIRDGDTTNAGDQGGGLAVEFVDALVNLTDVTVTENLSLSSDGGGIVVDEAVLTLTNSRVTDNQSGDEGGGIDNENGTVIFINSVLDGNTSSFDGGGLNNLGAALFVNSTVSRNQGASEEFDLAGSGPVSFLGAGGGIYTDGGQLIMINSTVSNNVAGFLGGGIFTFDVNQTTGEGITDQSVLLFNVTVAENSVLSSDGFGGGLCHGCQIFPGGTSASRFEVTNTIVFGNTAANSPDCGGDFISGDFNLVGVLEACNGFTGANDQTGLADAGLGPLQNNGGDTETHALLEGSPAIDMANNAEGCQAPNVETLLNAPFVDQLGPVSLELLTEDQRGLTRPVAVLDPAVPVCDIGAYEFQIAEPTPTPTPTATPVPPFNALLEGSGCTLGAASPASTAGLLWGALALIAGFYGLRKARA